MNAPTTASARRGSAGSLEEHADLPPEELRERVLREIAAFVGGAPQHDDMTMILLRVEDLPSPARHASSPSREPIAARASAAADVVTDLVVIFRTQSDVEASIVRGLLEAHGVPSVVVLVGCRTRCSR